ncbi:MAG TPA: hypothetical protein VLX89_07875 [Actinomycetota bacterium]|nr:hypothetical protein [Actinomycetota bacterium]
MSTQVLGGQQRSRAIVALVALALTLALFLLASEANSIRSARITAPVHVQVDPNWPSRVHLSHIPPGCRPKFGCENSGSSAERP